MRAEQHDVPDARSAVPDAPGQVPIAPGAVPIGSSPDTSTPPANNALRSIAALKPDDRNDPTTWPLFDRRSRRRGPWTLPQMNDGAVVPLVAPFRWCALAVAATLAAPQLGDANVMMVIWFIALPTYAALRTAVPLRFGRSKKAAFEVIVEIAINAAAVASTGSWQSPFVFCLMTAVIAGGFSRSYRFAIRTSMASAIAVTLPHFLIVPSITADDTQEAAIWTLMLLMVAGVSGYARRISTESVNQQRQALDRMGQLSEANELLHSLHQLAQTLPASLDLDEVLDSGVGSVRDLLRFDALTIMLRDPSDESWNPVRREGNRAQGSLTMPKLPAAAQQAIRTDRLVSISSLGSGTAGFAAGAGSGLYGPLRARGVLIGLVAVESNERHAYNDRDGEVLIGLIESLALAVDNAQWFSRLRTLGAEEERTRIARDLHDRIGQSLAYLGFELDRAVRTAERGDDITGSLQVLRDDVRGVIREVRDTLQDLRTDVSDSSDVPTTIRSFLGRVGERSGLITHLSASGAERLPIPVERELWRIASEAITNVERHAQARHLHVVWNSTANKVDLVISDDGIGYRSDASRDDSFGIIGMRERAASIGARLDIDAGTHGGTTVRVQLFR
ncbi:MAG: GAF domain-containing sensor histidine kinase [Acidimicrobiia bacterium]